jgi:hypothetical protein
MSEGLVLTITLGRPVLPPDVGAFHAGRNGVRQRTIVVDRRVGAWLPGRRVDVGGADHQGRLGERDDLAQLGRNRVRWEWLRRGAELPCGDGRDEEATFAGQADAHDVAVADTARAHRSRPDFAGRFELGSAEGAGGIGDGRRIGRVGRERAQRRRKRNRVSHVLSQLDDAAD